MAAAIVLLLLVPFAVALVRAAADGWALSGDEALIAIRAHDVFSGDPPLVGQPSTSDQYSPGLRTYHPGPLEFYLLAVPLRVLGPTAGPLSFAVVVNGGAVLLAVWAVFRRAGPGVGAWAAVVLGSVMWSTGTAVLTDIISSNMSGYPLIAGALLLWAVADGDAALMPLAAFVVSYAAQQHLAVVGLTGLATVVTAAALGLLVLHRRRARRRTAVAPWALAAVAVALVCWTPVAVDQISGDSANISAVVRFARDADRATLGLDLGARQALRAIGFPPLMTRTGWEGSRLAGGLGVLGLAVAWMTVAALVAVIALAARRRPALARLAGAALVVAAAGAVTGANVPASVESLRVNLYRWMWAAAACTWIAMGWAVALAFQGRHQGLGAAGQAAVRLRRRGGPVLVAMLAVVVGLVAVLHKPDDRHRDASAFRAERDIASRTLRATEDAGPLLLLNNGLLADGTVGPSIAYRLVAAGRAIRVLPEKVPYYGGSRRRFDPDHITGALLVTSRLGRLPSVPGLRVADHVLDRRSENHVAVHLLTKAELRAYRPDLFR